MKASAPKDSSHLLMILIIVVIVGVLWYYSKKKGWFAPSSTSGANAIGPAGAPTPNTLTQAQYVAIQPRSDGKGSKWTVTVPNIQYADRFQPGDVWQKDADGSYWTRSGNSQVQTTAGFTPTGGTTINKAQNLLAQFNPFLNKNVGITTNGVNTKPGSSGYVDSNWDYGKVMGDITNGQPSEIWDATPRAQALALMGQNIAEAQQAYDDFGQNSVGKSDLYNSDLATNTANLNRIYGAGNWPSWATKGAAASPATTVTAVPITNTLFGNNTNLILNPNDLAANATIKING